MVVKDNHKLLRKKIAAFFGASCLFEARFCSVTDTHQGHGRIETRTLTRSADVPEGYTGFVDAAQLFCVQRTRADKKRGTCTTQTVYGLTSLPSNLAGPKKLLSLIRGHWNIENQSHYVRDVTYKEDHSQVRKGSAPQVMAAFRNLGIGLMRLHGYDNIAAACRYHAARPHIALAMLGITKTE